MGRCFPPKESRMEWGETSEVAVAAAQGLPEGGPCRRQALVGKPQLRSRLQKSAHAGKSPPQIGGGSGIGRRLG